MGFITLRWFQRLRLLHVSRYTFYFSLTVVFFSTCDTAVPIYTQLFLKRHLSHLWRLLQFIPFVSGNITCKQTNQVMWRVRLFYSTSYPLYYPLTATIPNSVISRIYHKNRPHSMAQSLTMPKSSFHKSKDRTFFNFLSPSQRFIFVDILFPPSIPLHVIFL